MNVEKEIERLRKDFEVLEKKIDELLTEKETEIKFPCFFPDIDRECKWTCPAHSEHTEWTIKEGWKNIKTKVKKGHCKLLKLMEKGKVPKEVFGLIK